MNCRIVLSVLNYTSSLQFAFGVLEYIGTKLFFPATMGAEEPRFRILHVSNISMTATREQICQLFSFIGRIDEFKVQLATDCTLLNYLKSSLRRYL